MVESNKGDCIEIAERVNQLMGDLVESIGDRQEASLDPRLTRDLDRFEKSDVSRYNPLCLSTHLVTLPETWVGSCRSSRLLPIQNSQQGYGGTGNILMSWWIVTGHLIIVSSGSW